MKYKFIFGYSLILAFSMVSCQKELKPQESETTTGQDTVTAISNPEQVQNVPVTEQPAATTQAPVAHTNQPMATGSQTAPGMNPPHGQPGHICEIPVGAPLNSAPNKPAAPKAPVTQAAPQTMVKPSTIQQLKPDGTTGPVQNVETAAGMNPPHGQPGHICEIPVGSPLPK